MSIQRSSILTSHRQTGVGLIEVLVAVLLVAFGLLGAAGMHVRSIEYTVDTERRQMASTVATEMLEILRSDTVTALDAKGMPKSDLGGYGKAKGVALPSVSASDCQPLDATVAKRMGCWGVRAKQLIPELTDELLTSQFTVDAADGVVSVTVAWPVKKGQCLSANADKSEDEFCSFRLQSRL